MATSRAFAYNSSPTPPAGAIQYGNIAVQSTGWLSGAGGLKWWNGPSEDSRYIISRTSGPKTAANGTEEILTNTVGFLGSTAKTDESFLALVNSQFGQNFGTASLAKTWLNENGYWTSWVDTWGYDSGTNLDWPGSTTGYTLYTGGFNNPDDGYSNSAITSIDPFQMNALGLSNQIYVSTNGYVTIGSGSGQIISTPQQQNNPGAISANPSDNWLQPGLVNTDGDTQNVYYKTGGVTGRSFIKFIVYAGTYGAQTNPTSWILNLYIDSLYQWVETRVKSTIRGNAGPYNSIDVSQQASTTSRIWRGDLNGQNWEYMGTGRIVN